MFLQMTGSFYIPKYSESPVSCNKIKQSMLLMACVENYLLVLYFDQDWWLVTGDGGGIICQVLAPHWDQGDWALDMWEYIRPGLTYYYKYSNISQPETQL